MKLEHLPATEPDIRAEEIIRLFDFDQVEAHAFQEIIRDQILRKRTSVELSTQSFIDHIDCSLLLRMGGNDRGIHHVGGSHFECELTEASYRLMIDLIQPFVEEASNGHQWLYDLSGDVTSIEFLFSQKGTW